MASSKSVNQFAAQIRAVGEAAQKAQRRAVDEGSLLLKRSIEAQLTAAIGADHRMSNLTRNRGSSMGAKLSVGYDVRGTMNPTALLVARGPWGLPEHGADPHQIFPRVASTGRGRGMSRADRARAVRQRQLDMTFGARGVYAGLRPMPIGGDFRYSVRQHPGSPAKKPFATGLEMALPMAVRRLNTVVTTGVADVWRSGRDVIVNVRAG